MKKHACVHWYCVDMSSLVALSSLCVFICYHCTTIPILHFSGISQLIIAPSTGTPSPFEVGRYVQSTVLPIVGNWKNT